MIASENYLHPKDVAAIRDAQDSGFDQYSEGHTPADGKDLQSGRYYQQTAQVDLLELLAKERVATVLAKAAPGEAHVNVHAPSGAVANLAAFLGIMELGEKMVSPDLKDGYGHLSHGANSPSIVGKMFNVRGYVADPQTLRLDYDAIARLVEEHKPRVLLAGGSSYPRDIDWAKIVEIARAHNAITMADISHPAGPIAAGIMNDPYAAGVDVIMTTTHKTLRGAKGAVLLWRESLAQRLKSEGRKGMDFAEFPGLLGGAYNPAIAAHASTFLRAQSREFREEQERTLRYAKMLAAELKKRGWNVVTDGTDNHIVLTDITKTAKFGGKHDSWSAAFALESVGIYANKNAVPHSPGTAVRPAGLRFGTQAVSALGVGETEMRELAGMIDETLLLGAKDAKIGKIRGRVHEMAYAFPAPTYT